MCHTLNKNNLNHFLRKCKLSEKTVMKLMIKLTVPPSHPSKKNSITFSIFVYIVMFVMLNIKFSDAHLSAALTHCKPY